MARFGKDANRGLSGEEPVRILLNDPLACLPKRPDARFQFALAFVVQLVVKLDPFPRGGIRNERGSEVEQLLVRRPLDLPDAEDLQCAVVRIAGGIRRVRVARLHDPVTAEDATFLDVSDRDRPVQPAGLQGRRVNADAVRVGAPCKGRRGHKCSKQQHAHACAKGTGFKAPWVGHPVFEVEAKVALGPVDAVRQRVEALGGTWSAPTIQEDTFFSHRDKDMAASDDALRLRRTDALELTYKGPRLPGDAKTRTEHNVRVADDPTALLAALGWTPAATLQKTRTSATLDGCQVELDYVEGLGHFLEVEATGTDAAVAGASVESLLAKLGFGDAARIHTSYLELALQANAKAAAKP